ncbi:hypothetical protein FFI89_029790 [Bradyrhizobium sp. KBS0727]|jgi:hypothetical protein|uniref:hypothetical protein n=1 Tax=unclassified Bradyrhizobium TaxID=2631580 RepID=UPI00110D8834|nr:MULTISPECIES: hypothetical protein [unclassified Bradyrhizobium]QDW40946.1 hypothetical protein FFI71_029795 [Bradyrhizobium sp. KBS0725]QDW47552.1 hypothetical protein FFI89_029790 [Bradyrhizobium sp. KBS0727]
MRKLILISAFALASVSASVSAQAGDRSLILAANDTPAAAATTAPAETKPEAATTDTARPESTRKQASKSRGQTHARHSYEGDEAKARRIAARYGVYW